MDGFGMIFKALGLDPQSFILAIQEIQQMALSIAQKTAATDAKMERIERKVDALMTALDVKVQTVLIQDPVSQDILTIEHKVQTDV